MKVVFNLAKDSTDNLRLNSEVSLYVNRHSTAHEIVFELNDPKRTIIINKNQLEKALSIL